MNEASEMTIAIIGGCLLLVPFLWTIGYKPTTNNPKPNIPRIIRTSGAATLILRLLFVQDNEQFPTGTFGDRVIAFRDLDRVEVRLEITDVLQCVSAERRAIIIQWVIEQYASDPSSGLQQFLHLLRVILAFIRHDRAEEGLLQNEIVLAFVFEEVAMDQMVLWEVRIALREVL